MLDDPAQSAQHDELEPISTGDEPNASEPIFGSLADDVSALIDDGKTYLEAEIAFQKTRASYVGAKTRDGIVFGFGALALLHLALIGLVVGLIIALEPYLTAFGSVAVVVGVLLVGMAILAIKAKNRFQSLGAAFESDDDEQA